MYYELGAIGCTLEDIKAAREFMAKYPPDPEVDLLQEMLAADAAFYCAELGTEVQPNNCTEEGVARLKAFYDEQMATRKLDGMIAPFQRLKEEIQALIAQEQFEGFMTNQSPG